LILPQAVVENMPRASVLSLAAIAAAAFCSSAEAANAKRPAFSPKKAAAVEPPHLESQASLSNCQIPDMRPAASARTFVSPAVDTYIASVSPKFKDPNMGTLFGSCLPNSLDTTVYSYVPYADTFVVTGDIPAMWLRDSTNQMLVYLPFVQKDDAIKGLAVGLIYRHARSVLLDPYANAFQQNSLQGPGPHTDDQTYKQLFAGTTVSAMTNNIFERKYEVDSLANVLHFSAQYWQQSGGDTTPFTNGTLWVDAVQTIISTFIDQQQDTAEENANGGPAYTFQRTTSQPSDSLESGRGYPVKHTGMIKTGFRASDDAALLNYNIPENFFAASALQAVAPLLQVIGQTSLANQATSLAGEILQGIASYGIIKSHPITGTTVFAYEVDGFGNQIFMDDANWPSLLSLPVFFPNALSGNGSMVNSTIYQNTRAAVLSPVTNPWYFQATSSNGASGVGGPHNGFPWVWPLSLIAQAWTSNDDTEIATLLGQLVNSSACSGLIHESFLVNNYGSYTRPWFAWANGLFGQLVMKIAQERPYLIFN
jgi:uncharacterized protein